MERKVIATVAIGDKGQEWADISHPWMRRYAEACGADFFSLSGSGLNDLWPGFSKLLLGRLLEDYDRLIYVDSDILISPNAPNLFDVVPSESVGATRIDQLSPHEAPVLANGWVKNDIELSQTMFGSVGWSDTYYNSGALVFSKAHKEIFDRALKSAQSWHEVSTDRSQETFRVFADQSLFNYWTQALQFDVYDIGHAFNHTPAFNLRNHRYASHFSHYVRMRPHRRGNRSRQMRNDSWLMRHPKLHKFLIQYPKIARITDKI